MNSPHWYAALSPIQQTDPGVGSNHQITGPVDSGNPMEDRASKCPGVATVIPMATLNVQRAVRTSLIPPKTLTNQGGVMDRISISEITLYPHHGYIREIGLSMKIGIDSALRGGPENAQCGASSRLCGRRRGHGQCGSLSSAQRRGGRWRSRRRVDAG